MARLVLASQSPRRRELLAAVGIPFDVVPSDADESLPPNLPLTAALEAVALRKAHRVAVLRPADWILAADTAVVTAGQVLGKPRDRGDALRMLQALSGTTHQVVTAVALLGLGAPQSTSVVTDVTFVTMTPSQLQWYISLEEPYDKAGAYAIQGQGACLISAICGSYTNVVGLPMAETVRLLEGAGLSPCRAEAGGGTPD